VISRHTRLAAFVALLAPAPLAAQVDSTDGRPFVTGGVYDKPYLTRLGSNTAIGGYAEAHARWGQVDGLGEEAGFEAKRFNLFVSSRVSDFVRLGAELEIEEGGEELKLEYAAIDLRIHPAVTLRGGMLLSPLGRFNLSHDSPLNEFTDRPLVSTEVLGVALSEPGFGVLGQVGVGRTGRVTWEAYATNGFHDGVITASEAGTRIPLGRGNVEDNNASPALVGRVTFSPRVGYEMGLSAHRGAWNVFTVEGTEVDDRRNLTIAVLDAEATVFGIELSGEAAIATIDVPPGLRGIYAARQRGIYLDAAMPFGQGWVAAMPASFFTAKVRFDHVDFDADRAGQTVTQVSLGVNFRPTRDTALKFDLVRGRSVDEFRSPASHVRLLMSLATYF
jgi:hypothetical protein